LEGQTFALPIFMYGLIYALLKYLGGKIQLLRFDALSTLTQSRAIQAKIIARLEQLRHQFCYGAANKGS
jgi:hypothetical protein